MATRDYRIKLPRDSSVIAACEDVGCDHWRSGWETVCDLSAVDGRNVAALIRSGSTGRTYTELAGDPVVFRFAAGQRCFAEHRTRPARFTVTEGRRVVAVHTSLADLGEDLVDHAGRLQDQLRKG